MEVRPQVDAAALLELPAIGSRGGAVQCKGTHGESGQPSVKILPKLPAAVDLDAHGLDTTASSPSASSRWEFPSRWTPPRCSRLWTWTPTSMIPADSY